MIHGKQNKKININKNLSCCEIRKSWKKINLNVNSEKLIKKTRNILGHK